MVKGVALYLLVFLGCFLEGETALITLSFAAHRGYLKILVVMIIALAATQSWDWLWFIVGRKKGNRFIEKRPRLNQKVKKIHRLLEKKPIPFLLGYRFMFGFRTAGPLVIGMSSISRQKFMIFSLINTIVWDICVSSAGYFFGAFLKANMQRIEDYEFEIMGCIIIAGVIIGLTLRRMSIKRVTKESVQIQAAKA
jgi:membrane protein DedA with SNARE-associated domain